MKLLRESTVKIVLRRDGLLERFHIRARFAGQPYSAAAPEIAEGKGNTEHLYMPRSQHCTGSPIVMSLQCAWQILAKC